MGIRKSRSPRRSSRRWPYRTFIEMLECRQLLSTSVWTGAAGDGLYSTPNNWQGDVVPASGNDLDFPPLTNTADQTVDFNAAETVGTINVTGSYTFSGSSITLDGDINSGGTTVNFQNTSIIITTNSHFTIGTADTLNVETGLTDSSADTLDKYGAGTLVIGGASAANWQLLAGTFEVNGSTTINLSEFAGTLTGDGTLQSLLNDGGAVSNLGQTLTINDGTQFNGGTLNTELLSPSDSTQGELINTASTVTLAGSPTLNLTLASDFPTTAGTVYTLIASNGGSAVSGTFAGLPQGDMFTAGGEKFTISYTGGSSGHNVTLTTVGAAPTVVLGENRTAILLGTPITLTATVSSAVGSTAPTGTVAYTLNGTLIGTATLTATTSHSSTASLVYTPTTAGTYTIVATYSGDTNFFTESSNSVTFVDSATGPVIVHPASAVLLTAKSATLTVVATDLTLQLVGGLSYNWTTLHVPPGAQQPIFTLNNAHGAHTTTVLFTKDGTYTFQVAITNVDGGETTSVVQYVVKQYARILRITPHDVTISKEGSQQFKTVALDQFAHPLRAPYGVPTYTLVSGSGSVTTSGLYSAGRLVGVDEIQVTLDDVIGDINLTTV